ncbi:hypothetical protein K7432_013239 [Basidiobolus ranarum]|uniref:Arsenite methyltransferase n=1 Tax=Basidiobolus ranarum TaxID=34480 RepID=A0ABR2WJK0_9FUNG
MADHKETLQLVEEYYGKVLKGTQDIKSDVCTLKSSPSKIISEVLKIVPDEVKGRYYGCGSTVPLGIEGLDVLDLGSGSGRDCYVAAKLVGASGSVTGVDMTDELLSIASSNVEAYSQILGFKPNIRFVKGYIESLHDAGIASESIDLCISNCVVNLSPNKEAVLKGVYRVLREQGEFYFSDIYASRTVPESFKTNPVLIGEGFGGSLTQEEFKQLYCKTGFDDARVVSKTDIVIQDSTIKSWIGDIQFYAITHHVFKLPKDHEQTYVNGQVVVYNGTYPGDADVFTLDINNKFTKGEPTPVDAGTFRILYHSKQHRYFDFPSL